METIRSQLYATAPIPERTCEKENCAASILGQESEFLSRIAGMYMHEKINDMVFFTEGTGTEKSTRQIEFFNITINFEYESLTSRGRQKLLKVCRQG
jgi:hypothetical protein